MQSYSTLWQVVKKSVEPALFCNGLSRPTKFNCCSTCGTCRKVWSHKLSYRGPPPDENAFFANMKAASQDNENWNVNNIPTTAAMIYLCTVPAELTFRVFELHFWSFNISTICLSHKSTHFFCTHATKQILICRAAISGHSDHVLVSDILKFDHR